MPLPKREGATFYRERDAEDRMKIKEEMWKTLRGDDDLGIYPISLK